MAKRTDVRQWAVIGAEQRLLQISEEAAAIYRTFPELRRRGGAPRARGRRAQGAATDTGDTGVSPGPRRRRLSAAARKRISDAQKRRWAKQRASKSKG